MLLNARIDTLINSLLYFFDPATEYFLYSPDGKSTFEIKYGSPDKVTIWEVWKLKQYYDKAHDIKNGDIVVDIGANIGEFSIWAGRKTPGGKIYAYEPYGPSFLRLIKNVKRNGLTNIVSINQAVAAKNGNLNFYINDMSPVYNSLYKTNLTVNENSVNAVTLENIFIDNKLKNIDFLKIDAEGSEYEILLHAPAALLQKINKIFIEYHESDTLNWKGDNLVKFLTRHGFNTFKYGSIIQKLWGDTGYIKAWK